MSRMRFWLLCTAVAFLAVHGTENADAEIYKYKGKDGNWIFTDTPRSDLKDAEVKTENQSLQQLPFGGDLKGMLNQEFPPGNEIERASLSAVTVVTPSGTGSGFFITEDCYLLTNRHVVRGGEEIKKRTSNRIAVVDSAVRDAQEEFDREEESIKKQRMLLEDYKRRVEAFADKYSRERSLLEYKQRLASLDAHEERVADRRLQFESGKRKYDAQKASIDDVVRRSDSARECTITLKDKKTVEARVVMVSADLDLALLKIDQCKAPFLSPADQSAIRQGVPVYAIGSPVGITDTVSAGIVSGYDTGYIRTDAKIYPGNSGGPLVTQQGGVVGINTLKEYTRNYEGLGLAIPIARALQEFKAYLRP